MERKRIIIVTLLVGIAIGWMTVGFVSAYQEKDGGWSSSEKRQVIDLLEKIAENTRP